MTNSKEFKKMENIREEAKKKYQANKLQKEDYERIWNKIERSLDKLEEDFIVEANKLGFLSKEIAP
ncbi:MAG: hypothetical protein JWQ09_750 [Segetibacter sp.]|nr:hypothetical protein [Segetibacter sp.]